MATILEMLGHMSEADKSGAAAAAAVLGAQNRIQDAIGALQLVKTDIYAVSDEGILGEYAVTVESAILMGVEAIRRLDEMKGNISLGRTKGETFSRSIQSAG